MGTSDAAGGSVTLLVRLLASKSKAYVVFLIEPFSPQEDGNAFKF